MSSSAGKLTGKLAGKRVLVTGATGFIGGRLVERLMLAEGAKVRSLVSSYTRCARIARFPVELHRGDLLDRRAVEEAARGCEIIFHCAYGSRGKPDERRQVNVEGTENVLAAAASSGARLVHLSTQMVYGIRPAGEIDESSERRRSGSTYADSKLEAEERVREAAARGAEATILQPTAVYGPYAPVWTVGVLERMRVGRVPLVDGGSGACNAVYVDDVIEAMLLAALDSRASGEAFLVSGPDAPTWRDFYTKYEEMLGVPATVPVSLDEASRGAGGARARSLVRELPDLVLNDAEVRRRLARTVEGKFVARFLRGALGGRLRRGSKRSATPELDRLRRLMEPPKEPVHELAASDVSFFSSRSRVRIDKARRVLGYEPRFDLSRGMELTGEWAKWAGLVPGRVEEKGAFVSSV